MLRQERYFFYFFNKYCKFYFKNLLISCVSSEPFSTTIINPFSGVSVWNFKSAQGGVIGLVEPLGLSFNIFKIKLFFRSYC